MQTVNAPNYVSNNVANVTAVAGFDHSFEYGVTRNLIPRIWPMRISFRAHTNSATTTPLIRE